MYWLDITINGIADTSQLFYRLYQNGEKLPCDPTVSFSCVDGDCSIRRRTSFGMKFKFRRINLSTLHTTFLRHRHTNDLRDEFSSVATHIHRTNTRLAMVYTTIVRCTN